MELSILISTWNNCQELEKTFEALAECRVPDDLRWEIVVVNNNCTDATDDVIERASQTLPIKRVFERQQGLSYGRNAGIQNASGRFFIFTDDDVRPDAEWIQEYLRARKQFPEPSFFGGPVVSIFSGEPPSPELLSLATGAIRGFRLDYDRPSPTHRTFAGANWGVEASALKEIGLFDTSLGLAAGREMRFGEESEIQDRLKSCGLTPVYLPGASLLHSVPSSKANASYILTRAEALAFTKGQAEKPSGFLVLKLCLSYLLYSLLHHLYRGSRSVNYQTSYRMMVRRGRLRGLWRSFQNRISGQNEQ